jgi:hypothetical protein
MLTRWLIFAWVFVLTHGITHYRIERNLAISDARFFFPLALAHFILQQIRHRIHQNGITAIFTGIPAVLCSIFCGKNTRDVCGGYNLFFLLLCDQREPLFFVQYNRRICYLIIQLSNLLNLMRPRQRWNQKQRSKASHSECTWSLKSGTVDWDKCQLALNAGDYAN